jgi:pimeloyl-ACP methyl ester carboxylesterase
MRTRNLIAVMTLTGALLATGQLASASTTASHQSGTQPTIVLEHGAWADGSSWDRVVRRLQLLGSTVDVPPNPLRGLQGDAAYLASYLHTISGPIVLVGHSYGGAVITNAATGNGNVKALVYVDAFIPDSGQTLLQLATAQPGSCVAPASPASVFTFVPYPGGPAGDVDVYLKQDVFPGCMANGLPASVAAELAAIQRPIAASALSEPSGSPAWAAIPSWAVIGTADHAIPPAEQLAMAEHADAHITEIDAPHLSMISDPGAVTSVILLAVRQAS